jgi:uncharacterized protein (DUF362 family)
MEKVAVLFRGKRVLLKPNVCIDHPPEKGATTHPAVLDAVIALAKDLGAQVIVGDGAAVGVKGRIFERTGIQAICEKYGVELRDFNREQGRRVRLEDALALEEAIIAETYFEVDTIVNLPVFKSNMLYWISGALKNMKGLFIGGDGETQAALPRRPSVRGRSQQDGQAGLGHHGRLHRDDGRWPSGGQPRTRTPAARRV